MIHLFIVFISFALIGFFFSLKISDSIKPTVVSDSEDFRNFKSLEYGLFVVLFIQALGGFFFLANSWFLVTDRAKANKAIASASPEQNVLC
jgi:hypothetical protein